MVQLVTKKTALVLYGVLLVLPTLVLGGLHWHQILEDHRAEMVAVPRGAADAANRLKVAMEKRLHDLVERENARPFYLYKKSFFPPGTIGAELAFVPSPLATGPAPTGILGWFSYNLGEGGNATPEILSGGRDGRDGWQAEREHLLRTTSDLVVHDWKDGFLRRLTRLGAMRSDVLPLPVAAINMSPEDDIDCMRDELPALQSLQDELLRVQMFAFHLRFYVEPDGTPRALATRTVRIEANKHLREMPSCYDNLGWGATLVQGFYIDSVWLFGELPMSLSSQVLDVSEEFIPPGAQASSAASPSEFVSIRPIKELGFETYCKLDEDFGVMKIAVNTSDLEARFRSQSVHFFGVAAMLIVSLATGMMLLLRSVRRDLEAARRTENFVAAVTHELRTPLSAIRLYGEMLQDGWVEDDAKRAEYYRRIVRETGRLETLVERVLEKSQLASNEARPKPGDLNRVIESIAPALCGTGTAHVAEDVVFELAPDLPEVLLTYEAVRSIVTNLVENARKYAPVVRSATSEDVEPIRVVTRHAHDHVLLEVKDRGPGIPKDERTRIFDAFYRVGNETTRTARGTGLGLHLVALQSQAMQARVQVLDRKGGGTIFRVTFRKARETEVGAPTA